MSGEMPDSASEIVPADARMSRAALTMGWWGVCSAMYYIFVAAALAQKYGARSVLMGMLISIAIFAMVASVLVPASVRSGKSVALLSRSMLGPGGGAVASLLLAVSGIYFAVFEGSILAVAITKALPAISYRAACVLVVAVGATLVIGSIQRALHRINAVLLPVYLGGLVWLAVSVAATHGLSTHWLELGPRLPLTEGWWPCVSTYMGLWIMLMVCVDFARFGRPEDTRYHALINFGGPFYFVTLMVNGVVGLFLVGSLYLHQVTETSVVDATFLVLGSAGALTFIWATQTRINVVNFYISSINLQAVMQTATRRRVPRLLALLLVAVIVALLMQATGIFSWLLWGLNLQAVFITSWVGLALVDALHGRSADRGQSVEREDSRGLGAWLAGALVGLALLPFASLAAFAAPASLAVAALLYRSALGATRSVSLRSREVVLPSRKSPSD